MRTLIKQEVRLWLTKKRTGMLVAGVLVILIISTLWHGEETETKAPFISMGICNEDTSSYAKLLLSYIKDNPELTDYVKFTFESENELSRKFKNGELTLYGVVPEGFAENMVQIQNVPLRIHLNTTDKTKAVVLKNMLAAYSDYISAVEAGCVSLYEIMEQQGMSQSIVDRENVKISYDLIFLVLSKNELFKRQKIKQISAVSLKNYYLYAGLLLLISYLSILPGMQLIKEISQKRVHRLILCNISCFKILLSKVLFLSLVYVAVFIGLCFVLPVSTCLLLFSFLLVTMAFFLLLSILIQRQTAYLLCSNCLILLSGLICGQIIPLSYLPKRVTDVASGFLSYHSLNNLLMLSVGQDNNFILLVMIEFLITILIMVIASIKLKRSLEVTVVEL